MKKFFTETMRNDAAKKYDFWKDDETEVKVFYDFAGKNDNARLLICIREGENEQTRILHWIESEQTFKYYDKWNTFANCEGTAARELKF